ncbi:MAG: EMC3/TMCO1 family protein [Nanoarchaeota archaeon]
MVFSQFVALSPLGSLVTFSFLITLAVTIAYKYFSDQKSMRALKEEISNMQKDMKNNKSDTKKVMELQKKAMEKNFEYMKYSFKPMFVTFVPLLLVLWGLNYLYKDVGIVMTLPLIGGISWIWTYIIFSIILSLILRKILKVY